MPTTSVDERSPDFDRPGAPRPALFTLFALSLFLLAFAQFQGVFAPSMFRELDDETIESTSPDPEYALATRAMRDAYRACSSTEILALSTWSGLSTVLALVAGIGLLRRSVLAGRIGATLYALFVPIGILLPHSILGDLPEIPDATADRRPYLLLGHAVLLLLVVHGPLRRSFRSRRSGA